MFCSSLIFSKLFALFQIDDVTVVVSEQNKTTSDQVRSSFHEDGLALLLYSDQQHKVGDMAWGVLTFMVDEWASQLTLMDHELFARVTPWDFFHQATIPHFCWFNPIAHMSM